MDTLAHGLWGAAAFGRQDRLQSRWAFTLGMAPDLLSFGPLFLTHLGDIGERWRQGHLGHRDPSAIPDYVYHAYNVTHSLVVWSLVAGIAYAIMTQRNRRTSNRPIRATSETDSGEFRGRSESAFRFLWPFGAWALHILCDIPLHSTRFFPTPYLWPFATPFVNGYPWAGRWYLPVNYGLLALVYFVFRQRNRVK